MSELWNVRINSCKEYFPLTLQDHAESVYCEVHGGSWCDSIGPETPTIESERLPSVEKQASLIADYMTIKPMEKYDKNLRFVVLRQLFNCKLIGRPTSYRR